MTDAEKRAVSTWWEEETQKAAPGHRLCAWLYEPGDMYGVQVVLRDYTYPYFISMYVPAAVWDQHYQIVLELILGNFRLDLKRGLCSYKAYLSELEWEAEEAKDGPKQAR